MSFFTDDSAYRMTETTELADGINAVSERIQTLINNVDRFDVLDTFARGPMVVNERKCFWVPQSTWHGVGIFFIREGKIVDWYDYTIAMEPDTDQSVLMHARARFHENCISHWFNIRLMARPAGLEPATLGLEGRCSIRLSYGRLEFLCVNLLNLYQQQTSLAPSNGTTAPLGRYTPFRLTFLNGVRSSVTCQSGKHSARVSDTVEHRCQAAPNPPDLS